MIAVSCTQWDADTDCLAAISSRYGWLTHTHTHTCTHTHFRAHTLKCIFSECSSSRRTLRLSGGKTALYMVCHARRLLHPLPHVYTHRKKKKKARTASERLPRRSAVYVCSLQITRRELSGRGDWGWGGGGGGCCRVGRRARRLSGGEFLLPSTRTPSALYDNARVQERQS